MTPKASPKTPPIPLEIVEYVERLAPNKCPDLSDTERLVWYNAGRRSVAEKLRHEYTIQNKPAPQ